MALPPLAEDWSSLWLELCNPLLFLRCVWLDTVTTRLALDPMAV